MTGFFGGLYFLVFFLDGETLYDAIRKGIVSLLGVFLLAGCAVQRYRPLLSLPAQPHRGLNPGILPILGSIFRGNRTWVTLWSPWPPRLGIYKHSRSPLCISILYLTRLERGLRQRKQLCSRWRSPQSLASVAARHPGPLLADIGFFHSHRNRR